MPKILIVDDTKVDRDAMQLGAQEVIDSVGGGTVESTQDVETAISLMGKHDFDVVVADLQLTPDKKKEGWDVLQYARKRHPDTKVIIVTAYPEPRVDVRSIALGAFRYINKLQEDLVEQTKGAVRDALNVA